MRGDTHTCEHHSLLHDMLNACACACECVCVCDGCNFGGSAGMNQGTHPRLSGLARAARARRVARLARVARAAEPRTVRGRRQGGRSRGAGPGASPAARSRSGPGRRWRLRASGPRSGRSLGGGRGTGRPDSPHTCPRSETEPPSCTTPSRPGKMDKIIRYGLV